VCLLASMVSSTTRACSIKKKLVCSNWKRIFCKHDSVLEYVSYNSNKVAVVT
jgi:hypothetical protein